MSATLGEEPRLARSRTEQYDTLFFCLFVCLFVFMHACTGVGSVSLCGYYTSMTYISVVGPVSPAFFSTTTVR